MEGKTNKHHVIAKADGGSNHPDNICEDIVVKTHRNIHNLFGNMRPHSQIDMLIDISYKTWIEDRVERMKKVFDSFNGEYYKPHCIREAGITFRKSGKIYVPEAFQ